MADKSKGQMTVSEAGRKGGIKVRDSYGVEFYEEIGKKGGNKVRELIEEGKRARSSGSSSSSGRR